MHSTIRRAMLAGLLIPFGTAPVYRDSRSGELLVDTDAVRRSGGRRPVETGFEFGYDDDDYDDDDFDDDDDDEFDDDFDDEDFGYDDDDFGYDDEDDDDFGYEFGGRKKRQSRRKSRRADRKERRVERLEQQISKLRGSKRRSKKRKSSVKGWARTIVSGSDELAAAGTAKVAIRLQHHFKAKDITFAGSPVGTSITSIHFGDRLIFSDANGVDASVFGTQSFLRSLLEGQNLRAGLDITVAGELNAAGTLKVAVTGFKPKG
jgi:hypothetical protein